MFSKIQKNVLSGFSVFLIALPLCLGIAMASDFPPVAGILTAIVGGLIASWMGGAKVSIKGPAAGLIITALYAVHDLGGGDLMLGYKRVLAIGVVAGAIQMLIGLLRKATIAEIIPPSVIHGMLAAIGVIIVSKSAYVLIGVAPTTSEPLELIEYFPHALMSLNPEIFMIGILSLGIAIFWPMLKKLKSIPSSFLILLIVIPLSLYFDIDHTAVYHLWSHNYHLGPKFTLDLPLSILDTLHFPDFSTIFTAISAKYIVMFVLIGSIESLLTVCAIDSMAPEHAPSDLNKDLFSVGFGNLISSFIGGLPMISEIVRSKANIEYGANSAMSNFFHGGFLLLSLVLFPLIINEIPLSALAALLIFIGLKLTSPKEFLHVYKIGKDQFFFFTVTFVVTLLSDLLIGVSVGILCKIILQLIYTKNIKKFFFPVIKVDEQKDNICISLYGVLTFISFLRLKKKLDAFKNSSKQISLNLVDVTYIDHTVMNKIDCLNKIFPAKLDIKYNPNLKTMGKHLLSAKKV